MKKTIALLAITLLCYTASYSQIFTSENEDFINIDTKKIKLTIDSSSYRGDFEIFTSKKDDNEYLIYSYFSRTILVTLNTSIKNIEKGANNFNIKELKLIHSSDVKSIKKAVSKNGIKEAKKFIIVKETKNNNNNLIDGNFTISTI